ncbi:hypothetical protein [Entomobacter blattae]|uniref:hypothetical protein n=1 Tax=Entomobacter blattae TaxID=2762277 RepID=UPI00193B49D6|nr:hypothetical protein [Entomobacter blattae]
MRSLPQTIACILMGRMASLHELQTCYSVRDLYLMLDLIILQMENHARRLQATGMSPRA